MTNNYSFDNKPSIIKTSITYDNSEDGYYGYYDGSYQVTAVKNISNDNKLNVNSITLGLNHHFKMTIEGLLVNENMKFDGGNKYGKFLPVESVSLSPISVTNTSLNIGIFSDLPILSSRKMGRLRITLLDDIYNVYENAVLDWFQNCCYNGFVSPISKIIREAHYYEYTNQGKESKHYRFWLIPTDDISLNRNYNDNQFKKIEFSTIIVGDIDQIHNNKVLSYNKGISSEEDSRTIIQNNANSDPNPDPNTDPNLNNNKNIRLFSLDPLNPSFPVLDIYNRINNTTNNLENNTNNKATTIKTTKITNTYQEQQKSSIKTTQIPNAYNKNNSTTLPNVKNTYNQ